MVNRSIEAAASSLVPPDIKNNRSLVLVSVVSSDVAVSAMLSPGASEKLTATAPPEKKAISTKMKNIAEKMNLTYFMSITVPPKLG
jgi:hypothetical protein